MFENIKAFSPFMIGATFGAVALASVTATGLDSVLPASPVTVPSPEAILAEQVTGGNLIHTLSEIEKTKGFIPAPELARLHRNAALSDAVFGCARGHVTPASKLTKIEQSCIQTQARSLSRTLDQRQNEAAFLNSQRSIIASFAGLCGALLFGTLAQLGVSLHGSTPKKPAPTVRTGRSAVLDC